MKAGRLLPNFWKALPALRQPAGSTVLGQKETAFGRSCFHQLVKQSTELDAEAADGRAVNAPRGENASSSELGGSSLATAPRKNKQPLCTAQDNQSLWAYRMKALVMNGDPLGATELAEQMKQSKLPVSPNIYSIIISGWGRAKNLEKARIWFEEAKQVGKADVVVWNTWLHACTRAHCDQPVKTIMREMLAAGVTPTDRTYASLVILAGRQCDLVSLDWLWGKLKVAGYIPDADLYGAVAGWWLQAGAVARSEEILKEMQSAGFPLGLREYTSLISIHSRLGHVSKAESAFKQLVDKGLQPDLVAFNVLVDVQCRNGKVAKAAEVLQLMRTCNVQPDVVTFNTLLGGWLSVKDFSMAFQVLDDMKAAGIRPDQHTFRKIVYGLARSFRFEEAQQVFKDLVALGVSPPPQTFVDLALSSRRAGNYAGEWKWLEVMESYGVPLSQNLKARLQSLRAHFGRPLEEQKEGDDVTAKTAMK